MNRRSFFRLTVASPAIALATGRKLDWKEVKEQVEEPVLVQYGIGPASTIMQFQAIEPIALGALAYLDPHGRVKASGHTNHLLGRVISTRTGKDDHVLVQMMR